MGVIFFITTRQALHLFIILCLLWKRPSDSLVFKLLQMYFDGTKCLQPLRLQSPMHLMKTAVCFSVLYLAPAFYGTCFQPEPVTTGN